MTGAGGAPNFLGAGQQLCAACGVAVEATAGHDHATFAAHGALHHAAIGQSLLQHHALNGVAVLQQLRDFGVGHQQAFALDVAVEHARDHGVAHDQACAAWVQQLVEVMAHDDAHAVAEGLPRLRQTQEVKDVITVHHHAAEHGEFRNGVAHQGQVGTKQFAIKGLWLNCAATQHGTFKL